MDASRNGSGPPLLELKHISKSFPGVRALDDVSLTLYPGDIHAPIQIKLFEPVNQGLADRVRSLDINQLRPIEALQILQELQQELLNR